MDHNTKGAMTSSERSFTHHQRQTGKKTGQSIRHPSAPPGSTSLLETFFLYLTDFPIVRLTGILYYTTPWFSVLYNCCGGLTWTGNLYTATATHYSSTHFGNQDKRKKNRGPSRWTFPTIKKKRSFVDFVFTTAKIKTEKTSATFDDWQSLQYNPRMYIRKGI